MQRRRRGLHGLAASVLVKPQPDRIFTWQCHRQILTESLRNTTRHICIMEALAALSVAAATVQFVDFGLETLKLCRQIRQNEKGATEANARIEQAITELQEIQKLFKPAVTYQGVASQDIQIIAKARQECDDAANGLLQFLRSR
jgi:hypothetical protein